ncbi:MAG TPA: hypothetical protein VI793_09125 [Anaerolineales bacterium]|nr:hypothetical protein [Anaerolineales bacterium]
MPANNTEIEKRLWKADDDFDFAERLEELNEELETLNAEARELEARIADNVEQLLEKP